MRSTSTINRCIVLKRTNTEVDILEGRDVWWHEELKSAELNCDMRRWTQRIHFLYYIHPVLQENQKE